MRGRLLSSIIISIRSIPISIIVAVNFVAVLRLMPIAGVIDRSDCEDSNSRGGMFVEINASNRTLPYDDSVRDRLESRARSTRGRTNLQI